MFRSSITIRELALNLAKVIFILKYSVKLRRYLLCGCVRACRGMACMLHAVQNATQSHSAYHATHTPVHDMLPQSHSAQQATHMTCCHGRILHSMQYTRHSMICCHTTT